jgi:hypothetical protein
MFENKINTHQTLKRARVSESEYMVVVKFLKLCGTHVGNY